MIKYVHTDYGIAFDGAGSCSFSNNFTINAVIFGFDNSSLSRANNHKNNFLVGMTDDNKGSTSAAEHKFNINFSEALILVKQIQNFAWIYIKIMRVLICCLME